LIRFRNKLHKGPRRFIEDDDASGLQPAAVPKLLRMVSFLKDMARADERHSIPSWKAH